MFCKKCGKRIDDGASFCVHCGAKISWPEKTANDEQAPLWNESQSGTFTPVDLAALEAAAAQEPDPNLNVNGVPRMTDGVTTEVADRIMNNPAKPVSPKHRRNVAVITLLAAIAVVAVVFAGLMYWHHAEEEAAHALQTVNFRVTAEGYNPSTDSAMLVHVEGTDLDGNPVIKDVAVDQSGTAVFELMQGDYVASVPASPVLADGTLFTAVPASEFTVALSDNDVSGESQTDEEGIVYTSVFAFTDKVPFEEITDEMLDASYAMAIDAGQDPEVAKALCDNARTLRDKALEQERKRQENHIDGAGIFAFDIPEYWWDKVEVRTRTLNESLVGGGTMVNGEVTQVRVYVAGTDTWLVTFNSCQAGYQIMHGDISGGTHIADWTQNGRYVELYANAGIPYFTASTDATQDFATAADLLSFGTWSYDGMVSEDFEAFSRDVDAALNEKLVPTVTFA